MSAIVSEKSSWPDGNAPRDEVGMATGRAGCTTVCDNRRVWGVHGLRAVGHVTAHRS